MTVEEFVENYHCGNARIDCNIEKCERCKPLLKSDLRAVIEGMIEKSKIDYMSCGCANSLHKILDEELGGK